MEEWLQIPPPHRKVGQVANKILNLAEKFFPKKPPNIFSVHQFRLSMNDDHDEFTGVKQTAEIIFIHLQNHD